MGGVWVFKDGVARLVENPLEETIDGSNMVGMRRKVLAHVPTNQTMSNHTELEEKLREQGWVPYHEGDQNLRQYHRSNCCNDLISLPKSFAHLRTVHMYDIVVKLPNIFQVRDA